jgi:hypothetical protein
MKSSLGEELCIFMMYRLITRKVLVASLVSKVIVLTNLLLALEMAQTNQLALTISARKQKGAQRVPRTLRRDSKTWRNRVMRRTENALKRNVRGARLERRRRKRSQNGGKLRG